MNMNKIGRHLILQLMASAFFADQGAFLQAK